MKTLKQFATISSICATLIAGSFGYAGSAVAAAPSDQEAQARTFDSEAGRHAEMASLYRMRAIGGSKQQMTYLSIANHCDKEAAHYREAATALRNQTRN